MLSGIFHRLFSRKRPSIFSWKSTSKDGYWWLCVYKGDDGRLSSVLRFFNRHAEESPAYIEISYDSTRVFRMKVVKEISLDNWLHYRAVLRRGDFVTIDGKNDIKTRTVSLAECQRWLRAYYPEFTFDYKSFRMFSEVSSLMFRGKFLRENFPLGRKELNPRAEGASDGKQSDTRGREVSSGVLPDGGKQEGR